MEVLPPQDALKRHYHHHYNHHANHHKIASSNKPRRNTSPTHTTNNPNNNHNAAARSNRKRRSSNSPPPSGPGPVKAQHPAQQYHRAASPPTVGQIRILKRGEELARPTKPVMARPVLGPVSGFYAGSACVTSPPPSELPLPAFFTRRSCALEIVSDESNDMQKIATDLRRALKLC